MFVTNHATLGQTNEANGTYAPEITHVIEELNQAGIDYDISSINGGAAPLYGVEIDDEANQKVLAQSVFQSKINNTIGVAQLSGQNPVEEYVGVFYPGGFGLLTDLIENPEVAAITGAMYQAGKVVAAVCHGPAGLLPVTLDDGSKLLANKQVTCFTREEEIDFGTIDKIPLLLEEALVRSSGKYIKVAPWLEHVVIDGQLITGQNPTSARAVGKAIINALKID